MTRRGAAASWSQRHQARVHAIFSGRDLPAINNTEPEWSAAALTGWECAAEHLADVDLYCEEQVPESVRASWYGRRRRGRDAA